MNITEAGPGSKAYWTLEVHQSEVPNLVCRCCLHKITDGEVAYICQFCKRFSCVEEREPKQFNYPCSCHLLNEETQMFKVQVKVLT